MACWTGSELSELETLLEQVCSCHEASRRGAGGLEGPAERISDHRARFANLTRARFANLTLLVLIPAPNNHPHNHICRIAVRRRPQSRFSEFRPLFAQGRQTPGAATMCAPTAPPTPTCRPSASSTRPASPSSAAAAAAATRGAAAAVRASSTPLRLCCLRQCWPHVPSLRLPLPQSTISAPPCLRTRLSACQTLALHQPQAPRASTTQPQPPQRPVNRCSSSSRPPGSGAAARRR